MSRSNAAARVIPAPAPRPAPEAGERDAHRAIRARVDAVGAEAPRAVYAMFDWFNARHFAGALAAPLILITPAGSPRALGDYIGRDEHGLTSRIRIPPSTFARGWRHTFATLLHEMVHAWAHEVAHDGEPGYRGHGPVFAGKCTAIGAEYGWPEVAPKGRGGKAKAECWPLAFIAPPDDAGDETATPRARRKRSGGGEGEGGEPLEDGATRERKRAVAFVRRAAKGAPAKVARVLATLADALAAGAHEAEEADAPAPADEGAE